MNAKKILEETIRNGGYTHAAGMNGRYVVGVGNVGRVAVENRRRAVELIRIALRSKQAFGTWIDEHNQLWVDYVALFNDLDSALRAAKNNGELAIYDLKENKVIYV